MTLNEKLTLFAIFVAPIVAVIISLWSESRRRKRDQQTLTMRMLVSTRHLMGDAAYTTAINMIPIDFNSCRDIMAAWHVYIDAIQPGHDETLEARMKVASFKQTKLIHLILKHLGYKLSEVDIQATPYAAGGFVERDALFIRGWESWPRIAEALEAQNQHFLSENKDK